MQEFREQGATILLVTHNTATVQAMCQRAVWLDHGQVRANAVLPKRLRQNIKQNFG